jgi:hypothetical protein
VIFRYFCPRHKRWKFKNQKSLDNFAPVVHIHTMPKELDLSARENCVCFNLRWVTRVVTQFFDAEMRRHGIRPTQGSVLLALNAKESWSMAELSDWLGMDRTTLVRNLRPLQRDGLATGRWWRARWAGGTVNYLPKAERKSRNPSQPGGQPKAPQSKLLVNSVGPPSFPTSKLRRWP